MLAILNLLSQTGGFIYMKNHEAKLLGSRAVNKIGNVMYDYGNSTWIAGLGGIGPTFLGIYQLAENIISLILNPIGGAVADRFPRRKILLITDLTGGLLCALLACLPEKRIMLYGLIMVNAILAMMHAFSGTSFRSYVATLVEKDRLVTFNSRLEAISQIVSISSPVLAFLFVDRFGIRPTLLADSATFFFSFLCLFLIREKETHMETNRKGERSIRSVLYDIKEGMVFIRKEKKIFFLLVIASFVNFFIAGLNYLAPFSNLLFDHSAGYATLLTMGAVGSFTGALFADKIFKNSYDTILIALALCGAGLFFITVFAVLKFPMYIIVSGNFFFEFFLTIFNIHFFTMVQKTVPDHMLGRVFSSIYTVAILFMPLATGLMTILPFSVNIYAFGVIGLGVLGISAYGFFYSRRNML